MSTRGSQRAVDKQHEAGKMTARERIDALVDKASFVEMDMFVRHRARGFGIEDRRPPGDAVITGWGTVDGRPVFVFAEDFTVFGGSLGEAVSEKICKVMDLAMKTGAPLVGLKDSGGAHPGRRIRPRWLWADLPSQRHGIRRDPPDLRDHGPVRRRCGVLTGDHRLRVPGRGSLTPLHHRS